MIAQRRLHEGVNDRRVSLRDDEHVALVDRLPAANRRSVETEAFLKTVFCQSTYRDCEVLLGAGEIHEAEIDSSDLFLAAKGDNFFWGHGERGSLYG